MTRHDVRREGEMDFYSDEFRRQLRGVAQEHDAALKPWREALMRVFAGGEDAPHALKARLAGAPDRRSFLRLGGATLAGSAVLAACGKSDTKGSQSGTTQATTSTSTGASTTLAATTTAPPSEVDKAQDLTLLRTATSVELLAVAVYGQAAPLIKNADVLSAAKLFRSQHGDHAKQLQAATKESFGADKVYTKPNAVVKKNLVDPVLPTLKSDTDIVKFAIALENSAASTYVAAAGLLSAAALRQAIMAIGGVEARHAAILSSVIKKSVPTDAFWTIKDAVSSDAFVP